MAEFVRAFTVQGMDSDTIPRFQMVPGGGGKRYVVLRDAVGWMVDIADRKTCAFREIKESQLPSGDRAPKKKGDRFFELEGRVKGTTLLTAVGLAAGFIPLPVSLEIGVKDRRKQVVMFHFLRDNAGHRTRRPEAVLGEWLPRVNFIWKRQANVEIVGHGIRYPRISQNLGDTIMLPKGKLGTAGAAIAALGATGVDLNVFFVWRLQETGNTNDVNAVTTLDSANRPGPGTCIFEDDVSPSPVLSLAHEIGHHLGLDHDGHIRKDLMWDFSGERGLNLAKMDVDTANP